MTNLAILTHTYNGAVIGQRVADGYINATAMCAANGKEFADYFRLQSTKSFLEALSKNLSIPIFDLVISNHGQGVEAIA